MSHWVCIRLGLLLVAVAALAPTNARAAKDAAAENRLLKELLSDGVVIGQGPAVMLPPPVLADGLDAAQQEAALRSMNAKQVRNDPYQALSRDNYVLDLTFGKKHFPGPPTARRLDILFIVDCPLSVLADEQFLKDQFSQGNAQPGQVHTFADDELKKRGISASVTPDRQDRFAGATFDIFDRVRVSGGGLAVKTQSDESAILAARLDARFDSDPDFPNQWRPLKIGKDRKPDPGDPRPYSGVGAYVKLTALQPKPDAKNSGPRVFVEYHLVFDEPEGWFNGQPILSSKLPIAAKDGVKKFRDAAAKQKKALEAASSR